jgi:U3 small nucleolar RNA-associated protein 15
MEYRKTGALAPAHPVALTQNPESAYWQTFKSPIFIKEFSPINSINYVPTNAHASSSTSTIDRQKFAVSSATRVQVYDMKSTKVTKTFSRFKDVTRGGTFRADGKLLVAGDDSGLVQVFDASSRSVLRTLRGHGLPVHVSRFSSQPTHILTASDDRTVRLWDMPEEKQLRSFTLHTDYVRSAVCSPDNPSLFLSGSYDGKVRLWDARMEENDGCAMTMKHGAPVEDVLIYPTGAGGVALSAGGPVLRVWDLMMGGQCRKAISNHSKTITSLSITMNSGADSTAESGLGGIRVLSAGLDQLVKVYNPEKDYKVVHTMRYSAPILCLAISPDESQIAAGMADGTLCIRKRILRASEMQQRQVNEQTMQNADFFIQDASLEQRRDEIKIQANKSRRLQPYDRLLKSFRYRDALDEVLQKNVRAEVTFALLDELRSRSTIDGHLDGLKRAISGRDDITLEPFLKFLLRHAANPRWAKITCDCLDVVVDVYAAVLGQSPLIDELFGKIWTKVTEEVKVQRQLIQVRGALDMILARSVLV